MARNSPMDAGHDIESDASCAACASPATEAGQIMVPSGGLDGFASVRSAETYHCIGVKRCTQRGSSSTPLATQTPPSDAEFQHGGSAGGPESWGKQLVADQGFATSPRPFSADELDDLDILLQSCVEDDHGGRRPDIEQNTKMPRDRGTNVAAQALSPLGPSTPLMDAHTLCLAQLYDRTVAESQNHSQHVSSDGGDFLGMSPFPGNYQAGTPQSPSCIANPEVSGMQAKTVQRSAPPVFLGPSHTHESQHTLTGSQAHTQAKQQQAPEATPPQQHTLAQRALWYAQLQMAHKRSARASASASSGPGTGSLGQGATGGHQVAAHPAESPRMLVARSVIPLAGDVLKGNAEACQNQLATAASVHEGSNRLTTASPAPMAPAAAGTASGNVLRPPQQHHANHLLQQADGSTDVWAAWRASGAVTEQRPAMYSSACTRVTPPSSAPNPNQLISNLMTQLAAAEAVMGITKPRLSSAGGGDGGGAESGGGETRFRASEGGGGVSRVDKAEQEAFTRPHAHSSNMMAAAAAVSPCNTAMHGQVPQALYQSAVEEVLKLRARVKLLETHNRQLLSHSCMLAAAKETAELQRDRAIDAVAAAASHVAAAAGAGRVSGAYGGGGGGRGDDGAARPHPFLSAVAHADGSSDRHAGQLQGDRQHRPGLAHGSGGGADGGSMVLPQHPAPASIAPKATAQGVAAIQQQQQQQQRLAHGASAPGSGGSHVVRQHVVTVPAGTQPPPPPPGMVLVRVEKGVMPLHMQQQQQQQLLQRTSQEASPLCNATHHPMPGQLDVRTAAAAGAAGAAARAAARSSDDASIRNNQCATPAAAHTLASMVQRSSVTAVSSLLGGHKLHVGALPALSHALQATPRKRTATEMDGCDGASLNFTTAGTQCGTPQHARLVRSTRVPSANNTAFDPAQFRCASGAGVGRGDEDDDMAVAEAAVAAAAALLADACKPSQPQPPPMQLSQQTYHRHLMTAMGQGMGQGGHGR